MRISKLYVYEKQSPTIVLELRCPLKTILVFGDFTFLNISSSSFSLLNLLFLKNSFRRDDLDAAAPSRRVASASLLYKNLNGK